MAVMNDLSCSFAIDCPAAVRLIVYPSNLAGTMVAAGADIAMRSQRADATGCRQCRRHRLFLYSADDPCRAELERFVQEAFALKHAAKVCSFMPTLLAMRNEMGAICGVAGFRTAGDQALFLERYLDQPVERAIASISRQPVDRSHIVEVGNLAGISCRAAVRLVLELPRLLLDRGHRWIVFTATDSVRQLLDSYQAPLFDLGEAQACRVQPTSDDWGRYYDTHPRVMVGYLPDGLTLRRRGAGA